MRQVVRCAIAGCFRHRIGAHRSSANFLTYLVNHGWHPGSAEIGGVVVALYFCPEHSAEACKVTDSLSKRRKRAK